MPLPTHSAVGAEDFDAEYTRKPVAQWKSRHHKTAPSAQGILTQNTLASRWRNRRARKEQSFSWIEVEFIALAVGYASQDDVGVIKKQKSLPIRKAFAFFIFFGRRYLPATYQRARRYTSRRRWECSSDVFSSRARCCTNIRPASCYFSCFSSIYRKASEKCS